MDALSGGHPALPPGAEQPARGPAPAPRGPARHPAAPWTEETARLADRGRIVLAVFGYGSRSCASWSRPRPGPRWTGSSRGSARCSGRRLERRLGRWVWRGFGVRWVFLALSPSSDISFLLRGDPMKLGVNIDHIATLRQARKGTEPDPVHAAVLCELAGADGITVHLRGDRRHIQNARRGAPEEDGDHAAQHRDGRHLGDGGDRRGHPAVAGDPRPRAAQRGDHRGRAGRDPQRGPPHPDRRRASPRTTSA